jgi:Protein of unknown function (DUF2975)
MCRAIRVASVLFVIGMVGLYVVAWQWPGSMLGPHPFALMTRFAGLPMDAMASLSDWQRFLAGTVGIPYLVVLVWAFYRLNGMLRGFERSEFFESATVGHLRAFAGLLLLAKLLAAAGMHLRAALLIHWLGRENVHVMLNLSGDDIAVYLMCALFFLIARMMEEGRRLAEENREFV